MFLICLRDLMLRHVLYTTFDKISRKHVTNIYLYLYLMIFLKYYKNF